MKQIPLRGKFGEGTFALVDDADYRKLSHYVWTGTDTGYVARGAGVKGKRVYLHRELMNPPSGFEVDHINNDKLDNRRENLRLCKHRQNVINRHYRNRTGYRGIYLHKFGSWAAAIVSEGKKYSLGYFNTPEEAAAAYDKAAVRLHGEFARLNCELPTPPKEDRVQSD